MIDAVQRGDFVTFCQRRIVEDRVDEIVDSTTMSHDGLTDVD
jgi:hypothetical protein